MALALAKAGANVMLNGLGSEQEIAAATKEVAAAGTRVLFDPANMLRPNQIVAMVERCEKELGSVDILVNNAGIQHVAPVDDFPVAKWDAIVAINLSSNFHTIRAALPAMKRKRWGRIINVASAHALVASAYKSAYVAAKHGVAGLTKTVALEVAEQGITVNAICPGYVLTPLVQKQIPDTARARGISEEQVIKDVLLAAQPTKQFVTVEQVAALAIFLAGAAAASITGAILPIEGGWTAH
jgi:3-hydroxybutyrate dehydrogenase